MAIKELFYDQRPQLLLDPRASQRIDPRFKFTRDSIGTYVDRDGLITTGAVGTPRFEYDPITGDERGLLIQPEATNLFTYSSGQNVSVWQKIRASITANAAVAPDGTTTADLIIPNSTINGYSRQFVNVTAGNSYTFSFFAKRQTEYDYISALISPQVPTEPFVWFNMQTGQVGTIIGTGVLGASIQAFRDSWYRCSVSYTAVSTVSTGFVIFPTKSDGSSNYTPGGGGVYIWGAQLEQSDGPTSYIATTSSQVTRAADLLSVESSLPSSGSVYIDARAISARENDTLLSLKNSSNDKIDLGFFSNAATYNSVALIANYDGTSKSSLPLPVPTTDRERNIITYGSQNYQYGSSTARFATSLSSLVPTDLNKLSIGHDSVDPNKAFNGYINSVYLWSGELTPAVAEALVRSELDPINADTFVPTGPAGSLSIVINTQGAAADGDKVFELPAESVANDNDIVITWGDQTESGLENAAAELGAPGLTKTYTSAGIYSIFVEGQLENLQFNNSASAPDLVQIVRWGTTANGNDVFLSPSTMNGAFYGCSQLDFSSVARTTSLPDTSAVADWTDAFRGCSSITGIFPQFNFSGATSFLRAWRDCSSLTAFTAAGGQPQNVTNFSGAWNGCSGLTSFPNIDTSAGISFDSTWNACSSLTSFPPINTTAATNFANAWNGCSNLESFPLLSTALVENLSSAWNGCSSLDNIANAGEATSFPLINTAACTNFNAAWINCSSFTVFPLINTSLGENFSATWFGCSSLTSFPLINTSAATDFGQAWRSCAGLATFPLIDTSAVTNFVFAWNDCSSLDNIANAGDTTSFPLIDTGEGTNFSNSWSGCGALTTFPALDFDSATGLATDTAVYTGFRGTWANCTSLANFPAGLFNNTTCTRYLEAFFNCALTAASIENILVSIEAASTNDGNLSLQGSTNAAKTTWTTAANNAYSALIGRGWTITFNP